MSSYLWICCLSHLNHKSGREMSPRKTDVFYHFQEPFLFFNQLWWELMGVKRDDKGVLHSHWHFRNWSELQQVAKRTGGKCAALSWSPGKLPSIWEHLCVKGRVALVESFYSTREGRFVLLKNISIIFFFLVFIFWIRKPCISPGQGICILGKKNPC